VTKKKKSAKAYYTVGVRFLYGSNAAKMYTYLIHKEKQVHLGQELIADTHRGSSIVVVVRIDPKPQDTTPNIEYKYLTRKVAPL
jgi:hypothetical protein